MDRKGIKSLIYRKEVKESSMRQMVKYKFLGFTVYKRLRNDVKVETTYMKLFRFTKRMPPQNQGLSLDEQNFDVVDCPMDLNKQPLVSVIVPNFNHAPYLRQRLDSVYKQTYENFEVILLDDASSDNSVEILEEYARRYPEKTRLVLNDKNSGKVFAQWNRGLQMARGEYIWIAESDDYCDADFLQETTKALERQSVMISFARSVFVKNGKKVWSLEKYLHDLPLSWDAPFVMASHALVCRGFAVKNVIPNVSSAVFRNIGTIPADITDIWGGMSLCGDWLFYLWLIRGGAVSYTNCVTNYYRVHDGSTSLKIQKTLDYYRETFSISRFVARHYDVDLSVFEQTKEVLLSHYRKNNPDGDVKLIDQIYDFEVLKKEKSMRTPNILMCGRGLTQGGGEVFPIYLANELKRQGYAVTFIDFRAVPCDAGIRQQLRRDIPLIELSSTMYLRKAITFLGAEIIHTHEGGTDYAVGCVIGDKQQHCKHIITLHGMYEAISKHYLSEILGAVIPSCSFFIYIADKNLLPIKDFIPSIRLRKIGNGLPIIPLSPHKREELGIETDAFCLVLVSRALYEKGWLEAIKAVEIARKSSTKPIHLLLIGEGECYDYLKKSVLPPYIHLLGRKSDVRNYFAMADVGLLPSRFKGESFPLTIIECLMSGTPVLASDVGEVRSMITGDDGRMAGLLFSLDKGNIPVNVLAEQIVKLTVDEKLYQSLKEGIDSVVAKFDISATARQYAEVYREVLGH